MKYYYFILLFVFNAFCGETEDCADTDKAMCRIKVLDYLQKNISTHKPEKSFLDSACSNKDEPIACIGLTLFDKEKSFTVKKNFLKVLEKECIEKDSIACWGAAQIHLNGFHTIVSKTKAKFFHEKACSDNVALSCLENGTLFEFDGNKPEMNSALEFYNKACDLKNSVGCLRYANLHFKQVPKDAAKQIEYLKKACDLLNGEACEVLGSVLFKEKDTSEDGVRFLIKSCALGVGSGCYFIGLYYLEDRPEKSLDKGILYLEKGCQLKHSKACFRAGSIYSHGEEFKFGKIEVDKIKSHEFMSQACDLDLGEACSFLVRRAPAGAQVTVETIGKACLAGDQYACRNGGNAYKEEKLVESASDLCKNKDIESCLTLVQYYGEQDLERRVNEYQILACDAGHVDTCFSLGESYVHAGLEGNKKVAREMFKIARPYLRASCKLKHKLSCERLKQIK